MDIASFVSNGSSGPVTLLEVHPRLGLVYVAVLGVAAFVGTAGNILLLTTIVLASRRAHGKPLHGVVFIVNLVCSDLIVTAIINPFAIIGAVRGVTFFDNFPGLCRVLGSVCIVSCCTSLFNIGCISLNRYIFICRHWTYKRIYSRFNCSTMCIATWIIGILMDLPSHAGWSRHGYDIKTGKCLFDRTYSYSYTAFISIGGVYIPLLLIATCYVGIVVHVSRAQMRLCAAMGYKPSAFRKMLRQGKVIFTIFLAFAICWLPYATVILADRQDNFSMPVHVVTSCIAHLHASVNFAIYGVANRNVRAAYIRIVFGNTRVGRRAMVEGVGRTVTRNRLGSSEETDDVDRIFDQATLGLLDDIQPTDDTNADTYATVYESAI